MPGAARASAGCRCLVQNHVISSIRLRCHQSLCNKDWWAESYGPPSSPRARIASLAVTLRTPWRSSSRGLRCLGDALDVRADTRNRKPDRPTHCPWSPSCRRRRGRFNADAGCVCSRAVSISSGVCTFAHRCEQIFTAAKASPTRRETKPSDAAGQALLGPQRLAANASEFLAVVVESRKVARWRPRSSRVWMPMTSAFGLARMRTTSVAEDSMPTRGLFVHAP
jgi:hypothetical protein